MKISTLVTLTVVPKSIAIQGKRSPEPVWHMLPSSASPSVSPSMHLAASNSWWITQSKLWATQVCLAPWHYRLMIGWLLQAEAVQDLYNILIYISKSTLPDRINSSTWIHAESELCTRSGVWKHFFGILGIARVMIDLTQCVWGGRSFWNAFDFDKNSKKRNKYNLVAKLRFF